MHADEHGKELRGGCGTELPVAAEEAQQHRQSGLWQSLAVGDERRKMGQQQARVGVAAGAEGGDEGVGRRVQAPSLELKAGELRVGAVGIEGQLEQTEEGACGSQMAERVLRLGIGRATDGGRGEGRVGRLARAIGTKGLVLLVGGRGRRRWGAALGLTRRRWRHASLAKATQQLGDTPHASRVGRVAQAAPQLVLLYQARQGAYGAPLLDEATLVFFAREELELSPSGEQSMGPAVEAQQQSQRGARQRRVRRVHKPAQRGGKSAAAALRADHAHRRRIGGLDGSGEGGRSDLGRSGGGADASALPRGRWRPGVAATHKRRAPSGEEARERALGVQIAQREQQLGRLELHLQPRPRRTAHSACVLMRRLVTVCASPVPSTQLGVHEPQLAAQVRRTQRAANTCCHQGRGLLIVGIRRGCRSRLAACRDVPRLRVRFIFVDHAHI